MDDLKKIITRGKSPKISALNKTKILIVYL